MTQAMLGTTPLTDNTSGSGSSHHGHGHGQQQHHHHNPHGSSSHAHHYTIPLRKRTDDSDTSTHSATNPRKGMVRRPSAGNWGWFEDEVASEGSDQKSEADRKNSGLFRSFPELNEEEVTPEKDDEQDYKKSAVTAPKYVLEESMSSQQLWKHTAGNRPPQPVEERQFFEQLWAINFAQSKVDYGVSADVLQSSSPVALSPFAEGMYRTGPADDDYEGAKTFDAQTSTDDVASVKEAEADVVEDEVSSTSDISNILHRPFGPHFHRHTLVNKKIESGTDNLTVLVKGDNVFGTTVSKSFAKFHPKKIGGRPENVSVSISIGSYRVVESVSKGKYAQFLVIYCEGDFRETVGVWKRHSDFRDLSTVVAAGQDSCACSPLAISDENDDEVLPNALTSWKLLQKRQRWYRCLDAGYLSLKSFLLERFLHDILFESSTPKMLRDFVGVDASHSTCGR